MSYEKPKLKKTGTNRATEIVYFRIVAAHATLDGAQKQCSEGYTAGEELRNRSLLVPAS
ncbi:MAG: hypothetical protein PWP16_557, partial [Eubacteriaceae bacterium]|nr:hypothetical protein [Eubacteriaceae bacterium]